MTYSLTRMPFCYPKTSSARHVSQLPLSQAGGGGERWVTDVRDRKSQLKEGHIPAQNARAKAEETPGSQGSQGRPLLSEIEKKPQIFRFSSMKRHIICLIRGPGKTPKFRTSF